MIGFADLTPGALMGESEFKLTDVEASEWVALFPDDARYLPTVPRAMIAMVVMRAFMEIMRDTANALAIPSMTLPSGAGHDAMCIATLAPQGMIFVPSRGGVSHAPEEFTEHEHCVAGALASGSQRA